MSWVCEEQYLIFKYAAEPTRELRLMNVRVQTMSSTKYRVLNREDLRWARTAQASHF
jgi:hypothetical protein